MGGLHGRALCEWRPQPAHVSCEGKQLFAWLVGSAVSDAPSPGKRSAKWAAVRRHHLVLQPLCQVCGTEDHCDVHHRKPFHLFPDLELIEANLITLCRPHHYLFGHLLDWAAWNPDVDTDCALWQGKVKRRKSQLFRQFWQDDAGSILAAEYVAIMTLVMAGIYTGFSSVGDTTRDELLDLSTAKQGMVQRAIYTHHVHSQALKSQRGQGRPAAAARLHLLDTPHLLAMPDEAIRGAGGMEAPFIPTDLPCN